MTRRTLTDAERIASIREVIEAARGDWHEATALYSVGADLTWLLNRAEAPEGRRSVTVELRSIAQDAIDVLSAERGGPDSSGAEDYDIEALRARLAALAPSEPEAPGLTDSPKSR